MRRRISRKKSKKTLLFSVLLLVLVGGLIGYASLNRVLTIEGETTVSKNVWNVRFENVKVLTNNAIVETAPNIIDNGSKVNFVIKLDKPGDSYSFTVDVVNNGDIDAMLGTTNLIDELSTKTNYLDYKLSYIDGVDFTKGDLLKKGTKDTIKFTVTFKKDITAADLETSSEQALNITLTSTFIQADETAKKRNNESVKIISGTKGNLKPGDEIKIGEDEHFFVLSSDNSTNGKTAVLAKYNLLVGNDGNGGQISSSTPGYCLQSADTLINNPENYNNKGAVSYSNTNFWMNGNTLVSKYSQNDTIYYDSSANYFAYRTGGGYTNIDVYDTPANPYTYISGENGYIDKLKAMGAPSTMTGRLLTFSEVTSGSVVLDCNELDFECNSDKIPLNTAFWLSSAETKTYIWRMGDDGVFMSNPYNNATIFGVRPVIELLTADITD